MVNIFKKRTANTLTEIVIVIIIIGILASLALPRYFGTVEKAKSAEAVQILTALYGAEKSYLIENSQYTLSATGLDISIPYSPNFNTPTFPGSLPDPTDSVNSTLVSVQRSTSAYTLSILENGTIQCAPSGSNCSTIGY